MEISTVSRDFIPPSDDADPREHVAPLAKQITDRVDVLVADSDAAWMKGLACLLEDTEFRVVGNARNLGEAVDRAARVRPRIILIDAGFLLGGLDQLCSYCDDLGEARIVLVDTHFNSHLLVDSLSGCVNGYFLKGFSRKGLLESLRAIALGANALLLD